MAGIKISLGNVIILNFAYLASLADKLFSLSSDPGLDDEATPVNEATKPTIICVFCVLSG
jgi:hypothetical protein